MIIDTITLPAGDIGELEPVGCEYTSPNEVKYTMRNRAGELVYFYVSTATMMQLLNMSVALLNSYSGQMLRDLGWV